MKKISEQQQKDLDALYLAYYNYLCEYELGHPFVPYDAKLPSWKNQFEWYHKKDFQEDIEEEAMHIKVSQGY